MKGLLDIRFAVRIVLGFVLLVVTLNLIPGQHAVRHPIQHTYGISDPQFLETMQAMYGGEVRRGHGVETLVNGDDIFPAMLGAIREARSSVNFETYIYWSGEIALRFANTLAVRPGRGYQSASSSIGWEAFLSTNASSTLCSKPGFRFTAFGRFTGTPSTG
jgi:cardiolipin synthase